MAMIIPQAFLFRQIYLQLLLQDFNKDFMLISKNTESCRLNIVSQLAAAAAVAAAMDLLISLWAAVPSAFTGSRVLAHRASASLPCSLAVTHNYSGNAAECRLISLSQVPWRTPSPFLLEIHTWPKSPALFIVPVISFDELCLWLLSV